MTKSKKKDNKLKFYYPWSGEDQEPPFGPQAMENIGTQLHRLGYPMFQYQEQEPDEKILKAVRFMCQYLYDFGPDEKVKAGIKSPWVYLVSNSSRLLQALAKLVPVVFAMSTGCSVMTVENHEVVESAQAKKPKNIWEDDPHGDFLEEMRKTTLLVWSSVELAVNRSRFCAGDVANILTKRSGKLTLFLSAYHGKYSKKQTTDLLIKELESVFGEAVAGVIGNNAKRVHLSVPQETYDEVEEVKL